jgi:thioredoxin 1
MNHIVPFDTEDFHDRLAALGDYPTLLVFQATFCGPSNAFRELVERLVGEDLSIAVVEVDVEKLPSITRQYEVKGTPALVMLRNGEPVASRIGTMPWNDLIKFIEEEAFA